MAPDSEVRFLPIQNAGDAGIDCADAGEFSLAALLECAANMPMFGNDEPLIMAAGTYDFFKKKMWRLSNPRRSKGFRRHQRRLKAAARDADLRHR